MADLASSDVTITVEERRILGNQKRNRVKIVFGNGTLTYPSGGVPMPAKEKFGLPFKLDYLNLLDSDSPSGLQWKYDKTNNKLRGYVQGVKHGAAGSATLDDYPITTASEVGTTAGSISREASATSPVMYGRMIELRSATDAPASTTIYAEAVGF